MSIEQHAFTEKDEYGEALLGLLHDVLKIRLKIAEEAEERLVRLRETFIDGNPTLSAVNLAQYLALRRIDLRPLQERLASIGASSLGRGEAHIVATLDSVIELLRRAAAMAPVNLPVVPSPGFAEGAALLAQHTELLFGAPPPARRVRIMVTLPSQASDDYALVRTLMQSGMDCARINGAHDDHAAWERMVEHVRRAEREIGRPCRVLFDLAGHKIRVAPMGHGPAVRRLHIKRDVWGNLEQPGRVLLESGITSMPLPPDVQARFRLDDNLLHQAQKGDWLAFADSRGKKRSLVLTERFEDGWIAVFERSTYIAAGCTVTLCRSDRMNGETDIATGVIQDFPGKPRELWLSVGDTLLLRRDAIATPEVSKEGSTPAQISCTYPGVVDRLQVGDQVWINDGKLGAVVEAIGPDGARLRARRAPPQGVVVRADHGLNFPDTQLDLPPLTTKDEHDLDFACRGVDLVGFSFVETPAHMDALIAALCARGATRLPIVAKVETAAAVRNLPDILLRSMDRHPMGVMIARGDLAVELGNARLAEIQEELLWLCEAGHVPVIWATQVLEKLAKKGVRSRAEFTDAASGVRAECVMLNKGPYIVDAVRALVSVLGRMQDHQQKKKSRLRALHW